MRKPLWIGIDIGTTGVRVVGYHPDGTSVGSVAREYRLNSPHPGWAEQDAGQILDAAMAVLRGFGEALAQRNLRPDGLAISSAFHTFLAYDGDGRPASTLMTWADIRSQRSVEEMKGAFGDVFAVYARTGCPMNPIYPVTKIAWMRREDSEAYSRATHFGSIKDFVFRTLTGEWVVDRSIASGSGLYNLFRAEWDRELVAYLGIDTDALPPIVSTDHSAPLRTDIAESIGFPAGIPVVIGAGDGVLVNVGIGAVHHGQMSCTVGSSGAVRMLNSEPLTDPRGRTWCYNLTDRMWVLGGAINNGGIVLSWLRDRLTEASPALADQASSDIYTMMTQAAAEVPAGADGLIMLPFLAGERAPYWNADARGTLLGLNLAHTNKHIIRAVLEGVGYRMHSVATALAEVAGPADEIRVSGNFTRSELWIQILADIFDQPITVPAIDEGAAFGAAVLGFVSTGVLSDISVTGDFVAARKTYKPRPAEAATYRRLYGIYERIYWNLQKEFADISAFQNG